MNKIEIAGLGSTVTMQYDGAGSGNDTLYYLTLKIR